MEESFWPELEAESVKTPVSILKKQGKKLQEMTNGILLYEIKSKAQGSIFFKDKIINEFYIVAPLLDNLRYLLFSINYNSVKIFPINFNNIFTSNYVDINDWNTFNKALKNVLSHQNTKKILENLLAQSHATSTS